MILALGSPSPNGRRICERSPVQSRIEPIKYHFLIAFEFEFFSQDEICCFGLPWPLCFFYLFSSVTLLDLEGLISSALFGITFCIRGPDWGACYGRNSIALYISSGNSFCAFPDLLEMDILILQVLLDILSTLYIIIITHSHIHTFHY
jgi:hypothetical protein